jgi:hypothetical protein
MGLLKKKIKEIAAIKASPVALDKANQEVTELLLQLGQNIYLQSMYKEKLGELSNMTQELNKQVKTLGATIALLEQRVKEEAAASKPTEEEVPVIPMVETVP